MVNGYTYNPPIDIYTLEELIPLIKKDGTINTNIVIRGLHLKSLSKVTIINGSLGLSESAIEDLGNLKIINGSFWTSYSHVSSRLKTLGALEKVTGDVSLRNTNLLTLGNLKYIGGKLSPNTNLKTLGNLKYVGGTLNLKDSSIESLNGVEYIGGDLYLPKRLKGQINLTRITIKGRIKYFKESKPGNKVVKHTIIYQESSINPVFWKHQYIYSNSEIDYANSEQKNFYNYFRKCFFEGKYIDLKGNDNYAFTLFYDIIADYENSLNLSTLKERFDNLGKYYPITNNYVELYFIKILEKNKQYEVAWKIIKEKEYVDVLTVYRYQNYLNKNLIDGELLLKLAGSSYLTSFGEENVDKILLFIEPYLHEYEQKKCKKFFDQFFEVMNLKNFRSYNQEYFKQFYILEDDYELYKSLDDSQLKSMVFYSEEHLPHVVEKAIRNELRKILRACEDKFRESIGIAKIGEGWIKESELYYRLKNAFPVYEIINHGRPKWLGMQHLDIYFAKFNIGLEYQGLQHYEPVNYFGGHEAFKKTLERDKIKKDLCKKNGCFLIYVEENYDFEQLKNRIELIIRNNYS